MTAVDLQECACSYCGAGITAPALSDTERISSEGWTRFCSPECELRFSLYEHQHCAECGQQRATDLPQASDLQQIQFPGWEAPEGWPMDGFGPVRLFDRATDTEGKDVWLCWEAENEGDCQRTYMHEAYERCDACERDIALTRENFPDIGEEWFMTCATCIQESILRNGMDEALLKSHDGMVLFQGFTDWAAHGYVQIDEINLRDIGTTEIAQMMRGQRWIAVADHRWGDGATLYGENPRVARWHTLTGKRG